MRGGGEKILRNHFEALSNKKQKSNLKEENNRLKQVRKLVHRKSTK